MFGVQKPRALILMFWGIFAKIGDANFFILRYSILFYFHLTGHEHDSTSAVAAEDILCEVCRSKSPKKAHYYCDRCEKLLCLDCEKEHGSCTNTDRMETDLGSSQQTIQTNEITVPSVTILPALAQTLEISPVSPKDYQMKGRNIADSVKRATYHKRTLWTAPMSGLYPVFLAYRNATRPMHYKL